MVPIAAAYRPAGSVHGIDVQTVRPSAIQGNAFWQTRATELFVHTLGLPNPDGKVVVDVTLQEIPVAVDTELFEVRVIEVVPDADVTG